MYTDFMYMQNELAGNGVNELAGNELAGNSKQFNNNKKI